MSEREEEMLGAEVLRLSGLPRIHKYEELADEYSVRDCPEADNGIIVYGKFHGEWYANPGLRPVVKHLLDSRPLAPTPQPITADWLREQGWEEDVFYGEVAYFKKVGIANLVIYKNKDKEWVVAADGLRDYNPIAIVHTTADLAGVVAALRGGAR